MPRKLTLLIVASLFLLSGATLLPGNAKADAQNKPQTKLLANTEVKVGVDEKLGQSIPLETTLTNSDGTIIKLGDLLGKHPVIMSLVYYGCKNMCPLILSGKAQTISMLDLKAGSDYSLITLSFDPMDTTENAANAKHNYLNLLLDNTGPDKKPFPLNEWQFLTGDETAIKSITDSVGMKVMRTKNGFSHVAVLVVLSAKGKIIRYIYGTSFLPFDLKMAIAEAESEKVGISARRALLYCFSYDPEANRYVFNLIRVAGAVTTLSALIFFIYLMRSTKRRRKEMGYFDE